jgi:hypothetical protein
MNSKFQKIVCMACLWTSAALMGYGQAAPRPVKVSPVRLRYGSFSVLWPAQPFVAKQQRTAFANFTVYAVTLAPLTWTLGVTQYASPQVPPSPQQFAQNIAGGRQILGMWRGRLGGYPASKILYRIGRMACLDWDVWPRSDLDYILSARGPDGPQFRRRAAQFAHSFRLEQ